MSPPPAFLAQPPAALRADTQLSQTKGEEAAAFLPQPLAALRADTQLAQTEYEEAAAFLALPLAAASADMQLAQIVCEEPTLAERDAPMRADDARKARLRKALQALQQAQLRSVIDLASPPLLRCAPSLAEAA